MRSHKDLAVWQKSMMLVEAIYRLAKALPKAEEYRLTSQLIRSAISIPANIAEGNARGTRKDYAHFISIARGSTAEVETLLELSVRVDLLASTDVSDALTLGGEIGRILNVLRERLAKPLQADPNP
ncbi:MAG: four helix bundle protein [Hyphomicrobium sp.]